MPLSGVLRGVTHTRLNKRLKTKVNTRVLWNGWVETCIWDPRRGLCQMLRCKGLPSLTKVLWTIKTPRET